MTESAVALRNLLLRCEVGPFLPSSFRLNVLNGHGLSLIEDSTRIGCSRKIRKKTIMVRREDTGVRPSRHVYAENTPTLGE